MRALWVTFFLISVAAAAPEPSLLGYLGGSGTDDCDGIAVDSAGFVYLACHSDSADFPGVSGKAAGMDAVVMKIDPRAGKIVWATRTGGSSWDGAGALEIGRDGSLYVAGSTRSADFPTTADAIQRRFGGPERDAFLLKLDVRGTIVYSTLLGGAKNDEAMSLALAADGTVVVGGVTMSDDFPGTAAARIGPGGLADGFLALLRPGDPKSLRTIRIGGKDREQITSIAADGAGNVFAAGYTMSADFPAQPRFGGVADAFLLKLRLADFAVQFATFIGGSKMDGAYGVAIDASGNPIVSGVTESDDFGATATAFQPKRRGAIDAFVAKLSADGKRVLWSTYYGGTKTNSDQFLGGSLAVDPAGRVWLTGMTASSDLPLHNALQGTYGGGDFDGFLAALSSDGSKLCYGSYAGGAGHDILEGLAVHGGKIYASGLTASTNLGQKNSQMQRAYGGGPYDALLLSLTPTIDRTCR